MASHPRGRLWLWLFVLGCAGAPTPRPALERPAAPSEPAEEADLVALEATWGERDDGVPEVEVRAAVDVGFVRPAPSAVTLFFAPIELGDGDSSAVRFLAAAPPTHVDREAGTLTAPVVDGVARFAYRVALEHPAHEPVHGIDNAPHPTSGGWSVPGVVLFPTLARIDDGRSLDGVGALSVRGLPAGWSHHHSAGPAGDDAARVEHFGELGQAIHAFGAYEVIRLERGGSVVRLVSSDYDEAALAPLRDLVTRTLDEGTRLLGELPPGALTLVVDRVGASYEGGLVGARGIVLSGPDPGSMRAHEMPGLIVVHELMHLWSRADEPWLNEGFARMLEIAVGVILEDLDGAAATAQLRERLDRYHATAGATRRVRGDVGGAWEYEGGLATLLCVEGALREADTSLLALHRALREERGLPVRVEAFRAALDDASPGLGARLDGWLDHEGPIALAPCLRALGLEASASTRRGLTARALVVDVLRARGVDTARMVVTDVADGSALATGDRLLSVNGERARSLDEIAWALRDVTARARFDVEVERAGEPRTLRLRMPRLEPDATVEVPYVRVGPGSAEGRVF